MIKHYLGVLRLQSDITGFLGFPLSLFKQLLRQFPSSKLLLHASHAALPK
jgi:hypothetical protein